MRQPGGAQDAGGISGRSHQRRRHDSGFDARDVRAAVRDAAQANLQTTQARPASWRRGEISRGQTVRTIRNHNPGAAWSRCRLWSD